MEGGVSEASEDCELSLCVMSSDCDAPPSTSPGGTTFKSRSRSVDIYDNNGRLHELFKGMAVRVDGGLDIFC